MLPLGTRFSKAPNPGSAYRAEMGAVVLPDLDRCRRSRLHRHIGRNSGYRPLPVLCLRRDLPGAADPGANDLQGMSGLFPSLRGANGSPNARPMTGSATMQSRLPFWPWIASLALAMTFKNAWVWLKLLSQLLDLDPVRVERQMAGDLRHRRKRRLVGPDRVFECFAVGIDAEIIRIPLVGAVRHPVGTRQ